MLRSESMLIRLARLLLVVALGAVAGSCARPQVDAIRMGLASAPITLDPRFATDATSARIDRLLYRRLVEFDDSARPVPGIARWRTLSPTHYRFRLGDSGRTFHDGSHLNAADVKATYDSVLDPETDSPHRNSLRMIERIAVVDADTVDFYLKHPDPLFPGYLVIGILPAQAIAAQRTFARNPRAAGRSVFWIGRWKVCCDCAATPTVRRFHSSRFPIRRCGC